MADRQSPYELIVGGTNELIESMLIISFNIIILRVNFVPWRPCALAIAYIASRASRL